MTRFTDSVKVGDIKETKEGYLVATARVARTGIQHYLASELGDVARDAGFNPSDVVRVNRPPEEVFHKDSLETITRIPATVDHPITDVTADNWSTLSVGEIGDAYSTDTEWVVVNPMIKDRAGVVAAKTTHRELSMGYSANIVVAKDKAVSDFDMTTIRYNHIALVPQGRAGHQARIGDSAASWGASPIKDFQPGVNSPTNRGKGGHMTESTKPVILGDSVVQASVIDAAAIEKFKADSNKSLTDAITAHDAVISAKDEEIGKLKADLKTAQDAAKIDVDALVASRTELVSQVKAIDAKIEPKGLTDAELRKVAVVSKFGDEMVVNATDSEINGMFKAIAKDVKVVDAVADAIKSGVKSTDADIVNDAQSGYVARLTRQKQESK